MKKSEREQETIHIALAIYDRSGDYTVMQGLR